MFGPVAALLCLFVMVQIFGLLDTAREANFVDSEKTSLSLEAALHGHVDRIAGISGDNGYWDAAANAFYRKKPDIAFAHSTWGASTGDGINYDGAYVLDPALHTVVGMRDGGVDPVPIERRIGSEIAKLVRRPRAEGAGVGDIVMMPDGPVLVGMAQIEPTSQFSGWKMPAAGPYRIFFIKRLDSNLLSKTAANLLIEGIRLAPQPAQKASLAVRDINGNAIAWINWTPSNPGMVALRRSVPPIAVAMVLAIVLTVLIARQGARSVNALARQALTDTLCELPNRRALRNELQKRLTADQHVSLCLLDLDGFKFINDNYGHHIGDRLIISCAEMVVEMVGPTGFVARLGGDEFAFVISGLNAWEKSRTLADQILARMSTPFRVGERTLMIGASIGLSHGHCDGLDAGEMLRRTDVAMYAAKRAGKMRVCEFDSTLDHRQARMHVIENEMRASLVAKDFRLAYQPVFDAGHGRIMCVEALLRWTSPTLGHLDPIDFIPVAEESGLIDPLGLFILRKACEETLGWEGVQLAVNVSAAQLRNPDFPAHVKQILLDTRFPADRLELEITETYLVSDPETAGKVLIGLRNLGVSIALDDFGTGYASIGFLRQFSFDKLKLDRSLVNDAEKSEAARALLQASVAMARALNMEVAAEGVETHGQADLMRVAGCDQLQGWLFEKAMSGADVERMIRGQFTQRSVH
jgi:diguanylate cyclase (GGDEF)-like protein